MTVGMMAAIPFFGGIYISYLQQPTVFNNLNWLYVAVIYVLILPVVTLINALRFRFTAEAFGIHYSLSRSLSISIFSTVANMLPLPGGLMVRMANLKNDSNTYQNTALVSLYVSIVSALVTILLATVGYAVFSPGVTTIALCCFAIFLLATCVYLLRRTTLQDVLLHLSLVEVFSTVFDAIRTYLCFIIINSLIQWDQSLVLTIASVVGSAVSLVPAGLGVQEGAGALIATQIAILPSSAFIALALNRAIGLSYYLLLTIPLSAREDKNVSE
jgi:hypothetical protein